MSLAFKYRPRSKRLSIDDHGILDLIYDLAGFNHTQEEAASLLGVGRDTFSEFLRAHAAAAEAWADGMESGRASFRRMGYVHAKHDPSTWRFLSKQKSILAMTDGKEEEAPQDSVKAISPEEAKARVLELLGKVTMAANSSRGYNHPKALTKR
jgi:hypothetical protein